MQKRPLYWSGILVLLVVAAIVAGNFLLTKGIATHAQSPATSTPVTHQLTGTTTHIPTSHASLPQQSYQAQKSTSGIFTRYKLKDTNTVEGGITKGQDDNLWFTEINARKVGRITTSGWITTFQLPSQILPYNITTAGDGSLWFIYDNNTGSGGIARMTTSGNLTTFPVTQNTSPISITKGPDGAIWYNTSPAKTIVRIANDGTLTQFAINHSTDSITTGSDGALWFTEGDQTIGRLTTGGKYSVYTVPGGALTTAITAGPGNAVWFLDELSSNGIGKITTAGQVTTYPAFINYENAHLSDAKNGGLVVTISAVRSTTHAEVTFYIPGGTPKTVQLAATGTSIGPVVATSAGVLWMPDTSYIDTFTFQR